LPQRSHSPVPLRAARWRSAKDLPGQPFGISVPLPVLVGLLAGWGAGIAAPCRCLWRRSSRRHGPSIGSALGTAIEPVTRRPRSWSTATRLAIMGSMAASAALTAAGWRHLMAARRSYDRRTRQTRNTPPCGDPRRAAPNDEHPKLCPWPTIAAAAPESGLTGKSRSGPGPGLAPRQERGYPGNADRRAPPALAQLLLAASLLPLAKGNRRHGPAPHPHRDAAAGDGQADHDRGRSSRWSLDLP
jgi:hypothetical protein